MTRLKLLLLGCLLLVPCAVIPQTLTPQTQEAPQPKRPLDVHFVPTPSEVVHEMLRLAKVTSDDVVYDLGCGDGRIVIAAARDFGARGVGIDLDPARIREARENAAQAGVEGKVEFREQDLFMTDLREATVVTLYLLSTLNQKLRPKLLEELRPGARIVSHQFDMGDWAPDLSSRIEGRDVYLWIVPPRGQPAL